MDVILGDAAGTVELRALGGRVDVDDQVGSAVGTIPVIRASARGREDEGVI